MPRKTMDQALITGLSASANHSLVTFAQELLQTGALLVAGQGRRQLIDERRWSRATITADLAAIGGGLLVQRAVRQQPREPMPRAAVRTAGFWFSVTGVAAAVVGGLQESLDGSADRRRRSFVLFGGTAAALAGANAWLVRRRERQDANLPPEAARASAAKSVAYGIAISGGLSAFGAFEHRFADTLSRNAARVLPGNDTVWRPLAHAVALGGLGYGCRYAASALLHRIESVQEAVETAYDIPPPTPWVSGSYESEVGFDTLSRAGRRFVWSTSTDDVIEEVMGEPAKAFPIRVFVGLESAADEEARVDLVMRELERTKAFERRWLLVASPTGTGYVNYAAASILEHLSRGDCASVAMQYSARPSPLSLDRVREGRRQMRMLMARLRERLATMPEVERPKVVLFGESLGAWTSQDAYVERGTQGLIDDGVDYAIWIGTPHFSEWKERVLYDDRPDVERSLVGVFNDIEEWHARPAEERARIRYVMITHYDDGVAVFGPELAVQAPPWLSHADRPKTVPRGMRWSPTTTFFQVMVDMKNAANVVPGVFAARGHDYRADLLPFFHAVLGLEATEEQLARLASWLERRELVRTEWMQTHKTPDKSLSATVLDRLIREERAKGNDPNSRLIQLIRQAALEQQETGGDSA
jgi:uncharacterized membrane protein